MSELQLPSPEAPRKRRHPGVLRFVDYVTHASAIGGSLTLVGLLAVLLIVITAAGIPAIREFGFKFFYTSRWNPVTANFGAWPYIYSTVVTSFVALIIAVPISIGSAIFLTKIAPRFRIPFLPARQLVAICSFLIELLAAIPSIAYGLWGIAVLVPIMQDNIQPFLGKTLGHVPLIGTLFAHPASGFNIFTASVVLAIMVTPITTAIIRDVLAVSPPELEQGALGLGATWWQSMKLVLGYSKMGIFGGIILGLARAMGETMAVTMIIGNAKPTSFSLFSSGQTIASLLANQFNNADTDAEKHALLYVALVLLLITMFINTAARTILLKATSPKKRGRS